MATRRRAKSGSITGAITDLQSKVKMLSGQSAPSKLARSVVKTSNIEARAVDGEKLGLTSVNTEHITDQAVTTEKIQDDSITSDKIADGAITVEKMDATLLSSLITRVSKSYSGGTPDNALVAVSESSNSTLGYGKQVNIEFEVITNFSGTGDEAFLVSSSSFKESIENYDIEDAKDILKIAPKKFKYTEPYNYLHEKHNREWFYGYIAEELQELGLEEVLSYDKAGATNQVNYALLSLRIIELLKVQQSEIDSLREDVQRLKDINNV